MLENCTMLKNLDVVLDTPAVRIGTSGPVLVVQYRDNISPETLRASETAQERLLRQHPGGTLLLTLVDGNVPLPTEDARAMVADTFRRMAVRNKAAATVILGDGFWASAVRSTLTALTLVVRPPCPQKTFATVDEALAWLMSHEASTHVDPRLLAMDVDRMRTAVR